MTEDSQFQASKGTMIDDVVFVILYGHGSLSSCHQVYIQLFYRGWWMGRLGLEG